MQLSSKFTIAVHILTAIAYFKDSETVTSGFLAGSVGANPVIVRNVMGDLKNAGIIDVSQGKSGISLRLPLDRIALYDVYKAVGCIGDEGLFRFHDHPNPDCPVGKNIHKALDAKLCGVQAAMEAELQKTALSEIAAVVETEAGKETGRLLPDSL